MNKEEIEAVENHISNIPQTGAMYAPVLLKWLRAALKEETNLRERLRVTEELHEQSMAAIREAAGIERGGLKAILWWIEEAKEKMG